MSRIIGWIGSLAAVALFSAGIGWASEAYRDWKRASAQDRETIARLSASIEELRNRAPVVHTIEREVQVAARAQRPPSADADAERIQGAPAPRSAEAAPRVRTEDLIRTELEEKFDTEPIDLAWSERTKKSIMDSATALGAARNVLSVDCRGFLCRLESVFADQQSYNHFMDTMAAGPPAGAGPSGGAGMVSPVVDEQPDGSLKVMTYWVGAGHMEQIFAEATAAQRVGPR